MKPLLLLANTPPQFYRGGRYLAELRGARLPDRYRPEDWVASPVPRFGESSAGLTVLPDGRTLVDALAADPSPPSESSSDETDITTERRSLAVQ